MGEAQLVPLDDHDALGFGLLQQPRDQIGVRSDGG